MDEGTKKASQSATSHAPTALWLEHQLTSSAASWWNGQLSLLYRRKTWRGRTPTCLRWIVLQNNAFTASLNWRILIAYSIGLTRELSPNNIITEQVKCEGYELKIFVVYQRNDCTIYGSHISRETKVTKNSVTVSLLSLAATTWRRGWGLHLTLIRITE